MRHARSLPRAPGARVCAALLLASLVACSAGDSISAPNLDVAPPAHDPILFVHGWNANSTTWTTMIGRFKSDGWTDAELANWSYNTAQSNMTTAQMISVKVDSILAATGAAHVDIISHSMGALSARYYTKNLGGAAKVDAWVSLGGPNHGTTTAYLCGQASCVQMRPNSPFLNTLNSTDETPGAPRYATWWSSCDEVIIPQTSTPLSGATNNKTAACLRHAALHEDLTVYTQVRDWVHPTLMAMVSTGLPSDSR